MKKSIIFFVLTFVTVSFAQNNSTRFFFNPFIDATSPLQNTFDASLVTNSYANNNSQLLRIAGDYSATTKLILGSQFLMPQVSEGDFGRSFVSLGGRYNLIDGRTRLAVGSIVDLPVRSEGHLKNDSFFSLFSSMRYSINENLELAGSLRLRSTQEFIDYTKFLSLGGIYSIFPKVNLIGEMEYAVEKNNQLLWGGGLEYHFIKSLNVRGAAFYNNSDSSPDYTLFFGMSYVWGNY